MPNKNFLGNPTTFSLDGVIHDRPGQSHTCYLTNATLDHGMWTDINPLSRKLPMFVIQLIIVMTITRLLLLLAKPLRQPPFVAEYLAGLAIGPSLLYILPGFLAGPLRKFILNTVFAVPRVMMMETVANLGLNYHLFFLGLEMDLTALTRVGNKALSIGVSGSLFSFVVGAAFYYFGFNRYKENFALGCLFWGSVLSVTGLQTVGDLLVKYKLLHSEFGRVSLSSALVNGVVSWILLLICASMTSSGQMFFLSLWMGLVLAGFFFYAVRPAILWAIRQTQEGEEFSESTVCVTLTMVLFCGLLTDICGLSSLYGAFVFGLIIPKEVLGQRFLMVLQGFVSDLLLPLYYASVGMRAHLDSSVLPKSGDWLVVLQVIFLAFLPKLTTTLAVSYVYKIPFREGIAIGVLMNAKGLVAPIALTWGRDHLALDEHGYAMMILPIAIMTMVASPILGYLYKPKRHFSPSKHRALQKLKPDAELRILACIHELQSVPGITALIEVANATRRSPICLFALQLIRLAKHTTALLIEHGPCGGTSGYQNNRRIDGQTDQMIAAFEILEQENNFISAQPLTAMSDYATMHEDVCTIGEEKRVSLIVLPFHKRQTVHNRMEDVNPAHKEINENILTNAPCSVGILVDRGFGLYSKRESEAETDTLIRVCMLYIGGRDDREALTFASRTIANPKVLLTVIRFTRGGKNVEENGKNNNNNNQVNAVKLDIETEQQQDEEFIHEFRQRNMDRENLRYLEKESQNGAETVTIMKSVAESFDVFIVGRGLGMTSPLTAGLEDWSEYPELGAIGDLLISSDFPSTTSVFVVQQYLGTTSDHKKDDQDASVKGNTVVANNNNVKADKELDEINP
ncbi:OLC1v1037644C1 [Oldenlandia corymbosa var. corymbosa]|uniref:OLC1v1037644C1 n=1 Tax=Oldenlandia corymbosa var. corymbosa TaxID=529605 RepID=A0AAV1D0J2_OLDCO|nr:OLC1v1037644C1 [Oldenlandia corymbosa var. corymbosa]